jgi:Ni/Co efflux regulator RcnB
MRHILSALAMFATATAAAAQDQAPAWRDALERQLLKEHQCKVMYLTNIRERKEGSREVVQARAHCDDSRAFDVKRLDRGLRFDSQECGPVVC